MSEFRKYSRKVTATPAILLSPLLILTPAIADEIPPSIEEVSIRPATWLSELESSHQPVQSYSLPKQADTSGVGLKSLAKHSSFISPGLPIPDRQLSTKANPKTRTLKQIGLQNHPKSSSSTEVIAQAVNSVSDLSEDKPSNTAKEPGVAEVNNVSQLRDVQPSDWAYEALRSLVERYGCIAGYPDGTFRGNRALTRYEFAAGLNACLRQVEKLIASGTADYASRQDLATLRRLIDEFGKELAALRTRTDNLESRTAYLEQHQFSTTTKLSGEAIFALTRGGSGSGAVYAADTGGSGPGNGATLASRTGSANTTLISRVRLNLDTSFTGSDRLVTRLEAGNNGRSTANRLSFVPTPRGATLALTLQSNYGNVGLGTYSLKYEGVSSDFVLSTLRYDFSVGRDIRVSVGPVMHVYDHVDRNSYANNEAFDFSSTFFTNNPFVALINNQTGGAGAAIDWNPGNGPFSIRGLYLAANANNSLPGPTNPNAPPPLVERRGLFGNPYQETVELEFAPKRNGARGPFAIRFQYSKFALGNRSGDSGGVNFEWAFTRSAAVFGRYGLGTFSLKGGVAATAPNIFTNTASRFSQVRYSPQTFQIGFAFPDLFGRGNLAGIAVGDPYISKKTGNRAQTNVEAFFNFLVNDNIRITPDLQIIFNPNNNNANSTIFVGTLRSVFSF